MIKTKTVSIMVELTVDVPAYFTDEDINDITFDIPCDDIEVWSDGYPLTDACVSSHCTQEYYPDPA
jgi:hypothetical protein